MAVCCWYSSNRITGCLHCGNQTNVVKSDKPLFLVEFYVKGPDGQTGWDIKFAWVQAASAAGARTRVQEVNGFDEVIQVGQHAKVFPLVLGPNEFPHYLHDDGKN